MHKLRRSLQATTAELEASQRVAKQLGEANKALRRERDEARTAADGTQEALEGLKGVLEEREAAAAQVRGAA